MSRKAITLSSGFVQQQRLHIKRSYVNLCGRVFIQASQFTRHQNIHLGEKSHKSNLHAEAFTHRSNLWDIRGFILESNLTNVMNVIGFSSNVYSFGIMTVHTGQKLYKYTRH